MTIKTILITGGAGFIGSNLASDLIERGFRVIVLDDLSTGLLSNLEPNPSLELEIGSILNTDLVSKITESVDFVFHLAALGSVPKSINDPRESIKVNMEGTLNVVEACRMHRKPLIFSSSSSVYGSNTTPIKNEDDWTNPISPYGSSKIGAESLVLSYSFSYNLPSLVFRFFNVYGPRQRPDHIYSAVIPKWIWGALKQEEIQIFGDGNQTRDFTHVDNVVQVLFSAMEKQISFNRPINLAFGREVTLNEVLSELKQYFPELKAVYTKPRASDIFKSVNNPSLLNKLFSEVEPIEFSAGLRSTVGWLQGAFDRRV